MKSTLDYLNGHLCILNESELGAKQLPGREGNRPRMVRRSPSRGV